MMLSFFIAFLLYFNTFSNDADAALQEVLNIQQVQAYFSQSPRFSSSDTKGIILLNNTDIQLEDSLKINTRDISIITKDKFPEEGLIVFIKLNDLSITNNQASIDLIIQNARLLYEDNQQMVVKAQLKISKGKWEVKNYKLEALNISG